MSFVSLPEFDFPAPPNAVSATLNFTSSSLYDINGVGHYVAWIASPPVGDTIDRVFFKINAATTGCTCLARLETVDAATGLPTGTLVHANASQSVVIASGAADYEVVFSGSFTMPSIELFALVLAQNSGTPVGIQPASFADDNSNSGLPYLIDYDASAANRHSLAMCFGIGNSTGASIMRHLWPIESVTTHSFDSADSPDTYGNRVTADAPMRVCGAWVWADIDGAAKLKLYDSDGTTVLAERDMDANVPPSATALINRYRFASKVELSPGNYYLAVEATSGTNLAVYSCQFPSSSWRHGSPMGGGTMQMASTTQTPSSTGDWTLDDTSQVFMGLIVDGIESGGGGGGQTAHTFVF